MEPTRTGETKSQTCPKCGKKVGRELRPGSLTGYLFGGADCSCGRAGDVTIATASARDASEDSSDFCPKCHLKIGSSFKSGTLTGFLFQSTRCKCPPDEAFADGNMTSKFWKLRERASGTTFTNLSGAKTESSLKSIGLLPGAVIGGIYEIIKPVGRGGMGEVYLARHIALDKKCALKVIPPDQVTEIGWQRFQLEAKAVAKLEHINLVRVTDLGIHEGCLPFYAMDFVEGQNLADLIAERGTLSLKIVLEIFEQACDGVECAHRSGILHRDLKPANIMVSTTKSGALQAKVLDFGLAKLTGQDRNKQSLTAIGDVFGSPFYMSPEQCNGAKLDQRSDIYSLGCTMFECLTGRPPFAGHLSAAVFFGHLEADPPSLESALGHKAFPESMEIVMAKLLRKNPVERYQMLSELRGDLERVARGETVSPFYVNRTHIPETSDTSVNENPFLNRSTIENSQSARLAARLPAVVCACLAFVIAISAAGLFWYKSVSKKAHAIISAKPAESALSSIPGANPYLEVSSNDSVIIQNYFQGILNTGNRLFHFPDNQSIGTLNWFAQPGGNKPAFVFKTISARGEITVPRGCLLELTGGEALAANPELFAGFGPDDLYQLKLDRSFDWDDRHITHIVNLTGLKALTLNDTEISDKCIDNLNKLKALRQLCVGITNITGDGLARLDILPQINTLEASGITKFGPALKKMIGDKNIEFLRADACNLTDSDLTEIGTMSGLTNLDMSKNPAVTDKGVACLMHLPRLVILNISGTGATPQSIKSLQKIAFLRRLTIDCSGWPDDEKAHLMNALPRVVVTFFHSIKLD